MAYYEMMSHTWTFSYTQARLQELVGPGWKVKVPLPLFCQAQQCEPKARRGVRGHAHPGFKKKLKPIDAIWSTIAGALTVGPPLVGEPGPPPLTGPGYTNE